MFTAVGNVAEVSVLLGLWADLHCLPKSPNSAELGGPLVDKAPQ